MLIAEGGSMHRELNIQYADGTDRTVLCWVTAFELGGETERGLLGMLVDVSDEAALRQEPKSALRRWESLNNPYRPVLPNSSHVGCGRAVRTSEKATSWRRYGSDFFDCGAASPGTRSAGMIGEGNPRSQHRPLTT